MYKNAPYDQLMPRANNRLTIVSKMAFLCIMSIVLALMIAIICGVVSPKIRTFRPKYAVDHVGKRVFTAISFVGGTWYLFNTDADSIPLHGDGAVEFSAAVREVLESTRDGDWHYIMVQQCGWPMKCLEGVRVIHRSKPPSNHRAVSLPEWLQSVGGEHVSSVPIGILSWPFVCNVTIYWSGVSVTCWGVRRLRRHWRVSKGRCAGCGYPQCCGRCPECGSQRV